MGLTAVILMIARNVRRSRLASAAHMTDVGSASNPSIEQTSYRRLRHRLAAGHFEGKLNTEGRSW